MQDNTQNSNRNKKNQKLRMKRLFLHPTRAPFMGSLLIFFLFFLVGGIFHLYYPEWLKNILVLALTSSIGISGVITLYRREFIGKYGDIVHGWYAYATGIIFVLFGFGATIIGIYNIFLK